jgi:protein gp37
MGDGTGIEWTDATWTPIRARYLEIQSDGSGKERIGWHCEHVSPGCKFCYSESINRRLGTGCDFAPDELYREEHEGYRNGEVKLFLDEKMLFIPLHWKRPRRVFVCSMTDLFADFVPDGWIARMWHVMAQCPQHQFQVLTKRPRRMREWVSRWADLTGENGDPKMVRGPKAVRAAHPSGRGQLFAAMLEAMGTPPAGAAYPTFDWMGGPLWWPSRLGNVWLGVSVEDQQRADERIPDLLATPAAIRFLSCEPLLGPIDITAIRRPRAEGFMRPLDGRFNRLNWIIAGGESGPNARPPMIEWARSLRDQCAQAAIPFFWKQWGEYTPDDPAAEHTAMRRVGKKRAGAMLDGREHKAFPDG